jgi:small redox-active disulfide protein 2
MGKDDVAQIRVGDHKVGIVGLNEAMEELAKEFAPGTDEKAAQELLNRLKKRNYIPESAQEKYKEAFLREFKRFLGRPDAEEAVQGLAIKILGQGCSQCDGLEREIIEVMSELELEAEIEHVRDIKEIAKNGVMGVPALIINGQVKSVGNVPPRAKIIEWLKGAISAERKEHGA